MRQQTTWQGEAGRVSREDDAPRTDAEEWGHPTEAELELLGLAFCFRCALQIANRSLWSAPDSTDGLN